MEASEAGAAVSPPDAGCDPSDSQTFGGPLDTAGGDPMPDPLPTSKPQRGTTTRDLTRIELTERHTRLARCDENWRTYYARKRNKKVTPHA